MHVVGFRLPVLAVALAVALAAACCAAEQLHVSPMAGRWFPAEPAQLNAAISRAWAAAQARNGVVPPRAGLAGLVVPHAGLDFSGAVAAAAYRLIPSSQRSIIVLGFSHRVPLTGVATVDVERYGLPGGAGVAVSRDLGFPVLAESTVCDHSIENQLPFLRKAAPNARITPLYVGSLTAPAMRAAAQKLAARVQAGDLIVASSDFTHYGQAYGHQPFPDDGHLRRRLRERAEEAFEQIGSLNTAAFDKYLDQTGDTICGRDPIRLLMAALAAADPSMYMTTVDYMTSADTPSGAKAVLNVGYGALAFYSASAFTVDRDAQSQLLACSRATVEAVAGGNRQPPLPVAADPRLQQRTAAFVTIRRNGELRGCVGDLSPRSGLAATISARTIAAASADPRFPPLTRAEFPVSLEVSLLTPLKRIHDWRRFRAGQGAVLMLGDRGGLLLPQVAAEMKWNREQFLAGLARKAGLPAAAYRDPKARLYVFEAQVFGE